MLNAKIANIVGHVDEDGKIRIGDHKLVQAPPFDRSPIWANFLLKTMKENVNLYLRKDGKARAVIESPHSWAACNGNTWMEAVAQLFLLRHQ